MNVKYSDNIEDVVFTIKTSDSWYAINFDVSEKSYCGYRFLDPEFSAKEPLDEFTCTCMFTSKIGRAHV